MSSRLNGCLIARVSGFAKYLVVRVGAFSQFHFIEFLSVEDDCITKLVCTHTLLLCSIKVTIIRMSQETYVKQAEYNGC